MDVNSIIPSNFMPNGGLEKKAPENSITSDPSSPLRSDERIQSRYLKSHMPSCHDFCKYGKKHDFKTDATSANFRKFLKKKKNLARTGEQNQVTILVPRERRIQTLMKTKAETEFLDKIVVPESPSPTPLKSSIASDEKDILQASLDNEQSRVTSLETKITKGGTPLQSNSSNKPGDMKLRLSSINNKETKLSTKKPISSVAAKVIEKQASPLAIEPQNIKKKVPLPPIKVDVAGKPAITLKTKTPLIRSVSQLYSSRSLIARRNQERKITWSLGTSKISERKLLKTTTTSKSSKSSENLIHPRNKDNKTRKNLATSKISERIVLKPTPMHVSSKTPHENVSSFHRMKLRSIRRISSPLENISSVKDRKLVNVKENLTARENVASLHARKLKRVKWGSSLKDDVGKCHQPDTQSVSENIDSDPNTKSEESELATSEVSDEVIESNYKIEVPKGDEKKRERTASSRPEENASTPFKLKFRRGKVVNLRSDSIGARRLWFSNGMLGSENPNGDCSALERRNFRMKAYLDSITPNSEAQTVALKHPDVTEKKDAQSLFNRVIEETASKLVETRKSKVKALVGAFETVISLQ